MSKYKITWWNRDTRRDNSKTLTNLGKALDFYLEAKAKNAYDLTMVEVLKPATYWEYAKVRPMLKNSKPIDNLEDMIQNADHWRGEHNLKQYTRPEIKDWLEAPIKPYDENYKPKVIKSGKLHQGNYYDRGHEEDLKMFLAYDNGYSYKAWVDTEDLTKAVLNVLGGRK